MCSLICHADCTSGCVSEDGVKDESARHQMASHSHHRSSCMRVSCSHARREAQHPTVRFPSGLSLSCSRFVFGSRFVFLVLCADRRGGRAYHVRSQATVPPSSHLLTAHGSRPYHAKVRRRNTPMHPLSRKHTSAEEHTRLPHAHMRISAYASACTLRRLTATPPVARSLPPAPLLSSFPQASP